MAMLESLENTRSDELRRQLQQAGCVFDFVLYRVTEQPAPGEDGHRQVLVHLFEDIDRKARQHRADVIAQHPRYASYQWPELKTNVMEARSRVLSASDVCALTQPDGALERAFLDPPYTTKLDAADFQMWLTILRMFPDEQVEVLDWVGDPWNDPARSSWSSYFDDGKEWWGVWCLTLYNPRRRTLCALAASATD
ncbi:hypothetical protein [Ralstonia sp. 24A2]|uniref:hypothetical protein n=1 Tax=Ralstonia sp. 24A2 TaxID=3447364 RepID=UPI003F69CFD1